MDLLLAIKDLYKVLVELKIEDTVPPLSELEKIADELYGGNFQRLSKLLKLPLAPDNFVRIEEKIVAIKEIIKNEEKTN